MSPSVRKLTIVLVLLLVSVVIGSGLLALESYLAPFPGPDTQECYDDVVDRLEASTMRWQVFYLPVFQLWMSVGVGLLISGRLAWLQNLVASVFVLGLVFVHHATTSMTSAGIFVPIYLLGGMIIATVVRSKWAKIGTAATEEAATERSSLGK